MIYQILMHQVRTFLAILEDELSGTFDKATSSSCFCPFSVRLFYHVVKYSVTVISIKFLRHCHAAHAQAKVKKRALSSSLAGNASHKTSFFRLVRYFLVAVLVIYP
jgi:hypothetical protein